MITIAQIIDDVIRREGGYSNHPDDHGGKTMFGVTEEVARKNGWRGEMQDLPLPRARQILFLEYYERPGYQQVAEIDPQIAAFLVDAAVHMGTRTATKFLQRVLNVLNRKGDFYSDLQVDGLVGPQTLKALARFLQIRGDEGRTVLLRGMECLRGARYIELAEKNQQNESFVYGWLKNRIGIFT